VIVTVLTTVVMSGMLVPAVSEDCGALPLDSRPFWDRAAAEELAASCGREGLDSYRRMALLDLFYPASIGTALILVSLWAVRGRRITVAGAGFVIAAGIIFVVADYTENAAVWTVLGQSDGWRGSRALALGPAATLVKFGALVVSISALVVSGVAVSRGRRSSVNRDGRDGSP
jgi:hypothetical protein